MSEINNIIWDGWDCTFVEGVVGHMNWAHKDSVLIIINPNGVVYIPEGETIKLDAKGYVIGKVAPGLLDDSITRSGYKLNLSSKNNG